MSFYDDASLVFLAGGAAGKDGKVYNLKPDGSLGSELIADGGFDSASGWTNGTGWSISGGVASCDGTQTATTNLHETAGNGLVDGKIYRIEYTVTSYSAGSIRVKAGNAGFGTYRSAAGTYVENIVADVSTFPTVQFNADADFIGSIDNVSCKEVDIADFTFTRGTNLTATRVGKDGYIEKGRENLLKYSNTFTESGSWDKDADITLTSGQSGYDGSSDAFKIATSSSAARIDQDISTSGVKTFSVYAKKGTENGIFLRTNGGDSPRAFFRLDTGQVGSIAGSTLISADIEQIGSDGWYRCSLTVNETLDEVRIYVADNANAFPSVGDIYIQDAQLEQGLVATDYIESGSSTATAGLLEDEPRFDYTGGGCPALLLEPTRTNLVTDSEYFSSWSNKPDVTIEHGYAAPDGTNSAAKITETGGDAHLASNFGSTIVTGVYKSIWARTVSGTGTVSLLNQYAEGTVTLTEEWQRFEATHAGANFFYAVDFRSPDSTLTELLLWGAQAEEGSYPTSYIPTYGSAATRSKEGASDSYDYMNLSATNLYSSTSYTYFLDINLPYDVGTSGSLWKDNDNLSTNGGFQLRKTSDAGTHVGITTHDGSSYEAFSTNVLTGRLKLAIVYNNGEVSVYYNGVESAESPMTVTGWDQSTNHFKFEDGGNGTYEVQQFLYIPTALSNNDCEILTGTSYTSFASMASTLSYTQYE